MEHQETILFIGGSRDGESYAFPRLQSSIELSASPVPVKVEPVGESATKPGSIEKELYHLEKFIAGKDFFIYRHESLGLSEVFEKLLSGYRPNDK